MKKVRHIRISKGRFLFLIGCKSRGGRISLSDLAEMIRYGDNFIVTETVRNTDITTRTYWRCLKNEEMTKGDNALLTRIIRAGGFLAYIEKLEQEKKMGKAKDLIKRMDEVLNDMTFGNLVIGDSVYSGSRKASAKVVRTCAEFITVRFADGVEEEVPTDIKIGTCVRSINASFSVSWSKEK